MVELLVANEKVAGSNLVSRSITAKLWRRTRLAASLWTGSRAPGLHRPKSKNVL